LGVAGPWLLYCLVNYPQEFWHEDAQVWRHLGTNMEGWAAPWDRVAFDYLIAIYGVFYTPMLVAMIVLVGKAFRQRHLGLWLTYAWALGVLLPHLVAVTKTPSATVLAIPPCLLLLAHLIAEASRGERWPLTALAAIFMMSLALPAVVRDPGHGYPSSRAFGAILYQARWVLHHVGWALAMAALATFALWWMPRSWSVLARPARGSGQLFCAGVLAWLLVQTGLASWKVTSKDRNNPACVEVGQYSRAHLPENAVLFCEGPQHFEHLMIMFYADRTSYPLNRQTCDRLAAQVTAAGGVPYLVSWRTLPYPIVRVASNRGPTIYRWRPPG
jgi:hypothetical protein